MRFRAVRPTNRPIPGRRENLGLPGTLLGKSGNRQIGTSSGLHGVALLDSGGAYSDVPVACFRVGFWRRRGQEIDQWRRPAEGCVSESPRPHIARFRADAKIWDSRRHCWGNPEIGISGSCQEFMVLRNQILAARFLAPPSHVSERFSGENGVRKLTHSAGWRGAPSGARFGKICAACRP